jgi:hypothetical protein
MILFFNKSYFDAFWISRAISQSGPGTAGQQVQDEWVADGNPTRELQFVPKGQVQIIVNNAMTYSQAWFNVVGKLVTFTNYIPSDGDTVSAVYPRS